MNKIDLNKKTLWLIPFIIIILSVLCLHIYFNTKRVPNIEGIEYRTDKEPLISRFGETIDIESCFWKADTIGKTNFGPSSYWMKGFIILEETNFNKILS